MGTDLGNILLQRTITTPGPNTHAQNAPGPNANVQFMQQNGIAHKVPGNAINRKSLNEHGH